MIFLTKRERAKKIHTHTHTKFKRERKKDTHTHTHSNNSFAPLGRKESGSSPSLSLCQSEPAAHQCTMKDG
jgi:hypothetical protein